MAAAGLAACTTPIRHGRNCAAANPSGSTAWRTELTPTSRFSRAVRMGNGGQPPALLYVPDAQGSLHQGSTYCTYAIRVPGGVPYVPRTVAPQVAHMQPGKPLMPMRRADRQGEPSGGLAGRRLHILRARPEALGPARLLLFMTTAGPPPSRKLAPALLVASPACGEAACRGCLRCRRRSLFGRPSAHSAQDFVTTSAPSLHLPVCQLPAIRLIHAPEVLSRLLAGLTQRLECTSRRDGDGARAPPSGVQRTGANRLAQCREDAAEPGGSHVW